MSRIRPDQLLVPSILDRLLDDEPDTVAEPVKSRSQRLRDLKLSVRRDLENLLNSRCSLRVLPPDAEHLATSVLNYGIPDLGGLTMSSREQRENLRRRVEDVIRKFETRFKSVRVELVRDERDIMKRTIRFKIDGLLHAEPAPEPVAFESQVSAVIGEFRVQAAEA
jgi:type VI secretion system protein ImpF